MAIILLADDSAELRAVYATCLRHCGHVVHEAADGEEALALTQAHPPDLLLLDIWMPRRNGLEVLEALRNDPAATRMRVAVISVLSDADAQLEAFGSGAIEYIVKGLPLAEFTARVEALLTAGATVAAAE